MNEMPEQIQAVEEEQRGAKKEGGMALIFALLGVTLLSMLAASLMFVTSAGSFASFNFKNQMQAEFAANAGVQKAIDWFITYYAPNWVDTSSGISATGTAYSPLTTQPPQYSSHCVTLGSSASVTCAGSGTSVVSTSGVNFPDNTNAVQTSFAGISTGSLTMGNVTATYTLYATLLHHDRYQDLSGNTLVTERWSITSTGQLGEPLGGSKVQETAIIERMFIPLYKDAIRGQCDVYLGGSIMTDSFNSNNGTYGGGNKFTGADAGASVGSNSFIQDVGNGGTINGNAYYGNATSSCPCTGSGGACDTFTSLSVVQGQIMEAPGVAFPSPPSFGTLNASTEDCNTHAVGNGANAYVILTPDTGTDTNPPNASPAGAGHYRTCSGVANVYLCVPPASGSNVSSFYFNNIALAGGNTQVVIIQQANNGSCNAPSSSSSNCTNSNSCYCAGTNANCAPVYLYVNQSATLNGNGIVMASNPKALSLIYEGTSPLDNTGTSNFFGTIYAPYAQVKLKGNASVYGAVSAQNVYDSGNYTVHYDLSLQSQAGYVTKFELINQTRNVF